MFGKLKKAFSNFAKKLGESDKKEIEKAKKEDKIDDIAKEVEAEVAQELKQEQPAQAEPEKEEIITKSVDELIPEEKPAKELEKTEESKEEIKELEKTKELEEEPSAEEKTLIKKAKAEKPNKDKKPEEKKFLGIFKKKEKPTKELEKTEESKEEIKELEKTKELEEEIKEPKKTEESKEEPEKKERFGFLKKLIETKISEEQFEKLFKDLELELLQYNIAYEIVEGIKQELKEALVEKSLKRSQIEKTISQELKHYLLKILKESKQLNLNELTEEHKPLIILFLGVNGVGKTTTLAKLAKWFQEHNKKCVFAASDTFRAAAIEQLENHANNLKIKIIKHKYGADAAAVAFDAIKHAEAQNIDVVLIDTAGRSHANTDLMDELAKVERVAKPDLKILVVDSLTGNDAVEQATLFNEKIGIDASILTKTDADEKGGAMISIAYTTKKPILFIGTGQEYQNLEKFDPEKIIEKIF